MQEYKKNVSDNCRVDATMATRSQRCGVMIELQPPSDEVLMHIFIITCLCPIIRIFDYTNTNRPRSQLILIIGVLLYFYSKHCMNMCDYIFLSRNCFVQLTSFYMTIVLTKFEFPPPFLKYMGVSHW
jgi:hypothetical protein